MRGRHRVLPPRGDHVTWRTLLGQLKDVTHEVSNHGSTRRISLGRTGAGRFCPRADEISGFYIGGGVGQFNAGIDDVDDVDATVDDWDEDDTAYKFFARLSPESLPRRSSSITSTWVSPRAPWCRGSTWMPRSTVSRRTSWARFRSGPYFEVFRPAGYYFYDATRGVEDDARRPRGVRRGVGGLSCMALASARTSARSSTSASSTRSSTSKGLDDADALWLNGRLALLRRCRVGKPG